MSATTINLILIKWGLIKLVHGEALKVVPLTAELLHDGHQLRNRKKKWVEQEEKIFSLWRQINVWDPELLEDLSK